MGLFVVKLEHENEKHISEKDAYLFLFVGLPIDNRALKD